MMASYSAHDNQLSNFNSIQVKALRQDEVEYLKDGDDVGETTTYGEWPAPLVQL